MNLSSVSLPKPIVPNSIRPDTPITKDIVDHIDRKLVSGQGLFVVDFTGTLTRIICARLPHHRAKDVFFFDPLNAQRTISCNFLTTYPDEDPTVMVTEAVRLFQLLYGNELSFDEAELLGLGILTLQEIIDQNQGFEPEFLCPMYLIGMLLEPKYRKAFTEGVWNDTLRQRWQQWEHTGNKTSLMRLAEKLKFLMTDPRIALSINAPQSTSLYPGFDVGEVAKSGKIALITIPQHDLSDKVARYLAAVFFSRFERAAPKGFPLEDCYFFNGSATMTEDFIYDVPSERNAIVGMEATLRKYSAFKYGRKNCFVIAEQRAILGDTLLDCLDPLYQIRRSLPPDLTEYRKPKSIRNGWQS